MSDKIAGTRPPLEGVMITPTMIEAAADTDGSKGRRQTCWRWGVVPLMPF
ncbi:MAG: hypothetical protein WCK95_25150 [Alphaproteobacteria bacterium]